MFDKKNESSTIDSASVFRPAKGSSKVIIGEGVTLKGEITNANEVQIDGIADVVLKTDNLTVGSTGNLKGSIETENADIWGKIDGDVKVSNTLTIQELGSASGKIEYAKMQIKLGGEITGDLIRNEKVKKIRPDLKDDVNIVKPLQDVLDKKQ
jgi:cytoskeletal protein CcmA (bactofilin family)